MLLDHAPVDERLAVRHARKVRVLDLAPKMGDLVQDSLAGLTQSPKTLPCKYFYDAEGSALFEKITRLPEYYPTRTELAIMLEHGTEMADAIGSRARIVEFGSGSGRKTRELVLRLDDPVELVLVEISRDALLESAKHLSERFKDLEVLGVCADYTTEFAPPKPQRTAARTVGYFPGSTLGNFTRAEATEFLSRVRKLVGPEGGLLLGVDRIKDVATLEAAYDDAQGVTAAFNMNLLTRLNDAGANFDMDAFHHRAVYNDGARRIEMHLVSERDQQIMLDGTQVSFAEGESICTEHSHKYELDQLSAMARKAGFALSRVWSDEREWFSVCYLTAR